MLCPKFYIN